MGGGVGSNEGSLRGDILFQALGTTRNALEGDSWHGAAPPCGAGDDPTLGRGPLLRCLESGMYKMLGP